MRLKLLSGQALALIVLNQSAFAASPFSGQASAPSSEEVSSLMGGLPLAVAVVAATIAYLFNCRLEGKRSELKFLNDQIQFFYGPLFSLSHASEQAWRAFRARCRPSGAFFRPDDIPSLSEMKEWRHWMVSVFMPINLDSEKIIINNSHLINGGGMPESFLQLLSHVESYKAIVAKWSDLPLYENKPYAEIVSKNTAFIDFPDKFHSEIRNTFVQLKKRQAKLLRSF